LGERILFISACFEEYKEKGNGFLVAVTRSASEHCAQIINYLKSTGKQFGLLVNFGYRPKIEYERFVNQPLSRVSRIS